MDQTETATETESQSTDQERLAAEEQAKVLRAISDRLGNIVAGPAGHRELRSIGRTVPTIPEDLKYLINEIAELKKQVDGALNQIGRGRLLPEIDEGNPMIDLKYTKY